MFGGCRARQTSGSTKRTPDVAQIDFASRDDRLQYHLALALHPSSCVWSSILIGSVRRNKVGRSEEMGEDVGTALAAEINRIVTCPYPTQLKVSLWQTRARVSVATTDPADYNRHYTRSSQEHHPSISRPGPSPHNARSSRWSPKSSPHCRHGRMHSTFSPLSHPAKTYVTGSSATSPSSSTASSPAPSPRMPDQKTSASPSPSCSTIYRPPFPFRL